MDLNKLFVFLLVITITSAPSDNLGVSVDLYSPQRHLILSEINRLIMLDEHFLHVLGHVKIQILLDESILRYICQLIMQDTALIGVHAYSTPCL